MSDLDERMAEMRMRWVLTDIDSLHAEKARLLRGLLTARAEGRRAGLEEAMAAIESMRTEWNMIGGYYAGARAALNGMEARLRSLLDAPEAGK